MDRTNFACCILLASAFVLSGMLLMQTQPTAKAEMVVNKDTVTLMTAKTRPDAESLFVIDSLNEKMLIYNTDLGKKRILLAQTVNLKTLFGKGGR